MNKYVWDFSLEKIEPFIVESVETSFVLEKGAIVEIDESKALKFTDKIQLFSVEMLPGTMYGVVSGVDSIRFNRVWWNKDFFSFKPDTKNIVFIKTYDEEIYKISITYNEVMEHLVKKTIPTISINGQNIGGLKLKDNLGVIKEVSNIVYKDSTGRIRNLK